MRDSNLEELLGTLLQERRTELKLTQDRLAKKAGLHRTHISLLERGERSPTASTLFRVCRELRIRPSEVFKRLEDKLGWTLLFG